MSYYPPGLRRSPQSAVTPRAYQSSAMNVFPLTTFAFVTLFITVEVVVLLPKFTVPCAQLWIEQASSNTNLSITFICTPSSTWVNGRRLVPARKVNQRVRRRRSAVAQPGAFPRWRRKASPSDPGWVLGRIAGRFQKRQWDQ